VEKEKIKMKEKHKKIEVSYNEHKGIEKVSVAQIKETT
jgi:hypothetical protein